MLLKRVVIVAVLTVLFSSSYVWAHCHNNTSCEDLDADLVTFDKWIEPNDNHVTFLLNSPGGYPLLGTDVRYAASRWSRIGYLNSRIRFKVSQEGITNISAGQRDTYNVVSWVDYLPWGENNQYIGARAHVYFFDDDFDRIQEADIGFNYYAPYDRHGYTADDEICIREVATHEFGHWIFLEDLLASDDPNDPHCWIYEEYTMWGSIGYNEHDKETLRCEDKWGAYRTYGLESDDDDN